MTIMKALDCALICERTRSSSALFSAKPGESTRIKPFCTTRHGTRRHSRRSAAKSARERRGESLGGHAPSAEGHSIGVGGTGKRSFGGPHFEGTDEADRPRSPIRRLCRLWRCQFWASPLSAL